MVIEYHIKYAMWIKSANLSDPAILNQMRNDPGPTTISIIYIY